MLCVLDNCCLVENTTDHETHPPGSHCLPGRGGDEGEWCVCKNRVVWVTMVVVVCTHVVVVVVVVVVSVCNPLLFYTYTVHTPYTPHTPTILPYTTLTILIPHPTHLFGHVFTLGKAVVQIIQP